MRMSARQIVVLSQLAFLVLVGCGNRDPIVPPRELPGRDLNAAGLEFYYRGELAKAEETFLDALAATEAIDDLPGKATALFNLALVHVDQGRHGEALEELRISEKLFRQRKDARGVARSLAAQGSVHALEGDPDLAEKTYALALSEAPSDVEAEILVNIASLYLGHGRIEEAREKAEKAVALAEREAVRSDALFVLARVLLARDDLEAARQALLEVLELDRLLDRRRQLADTLVQLATLAGRQGRNQEARDYFDRAAGVYRGLGLDQLADRAQMAAPQGTSTVSP